MLVCLSVDATSFIEVLCSWYCIYVASIIVAQIIRSFCSHILQFQLLQQLYKSQCQSVCLSVRNKFYGSVMLLLVHNCCYCCCSLLYLNILMSYFAFLGAIAALKVTMSVCNKFYTSYNAATRLCMLYSMQLTLLMLICSMQQSSVVIVHTKVIICNCVYKSKQLQKCIKNCQLPQCSNVLSIRCNCTSANKS